MAAGLRLNDKAFDQMVTDVADRVRALNPDDVGFTAAAVREVHGVVDEFALQTPVHDRISSEFAILLTRAVEDLLRADAEKGAQEVRGHAAKMQAVGTALMSAARIGQDEARLFEQYPQSNRRLRTEAPTFETLRSELGGLMGLAAAFGMEGEHNSYYRFEVDNTVRGERSNDVGEYGVRSRRHMAPFEVLDLEAQGTTLDYRRALEDSSPAVFYDVLIKNTRGVYDALEGVVNAAQGQIVTDRDNYAALVRDELPNPLELQEGDRPSFLLSDELKQYLQTLGAQLHCVWEDVEQDRKNIKINWDRAPEARKALAATHDQWVKSNPDRAGPADLLPFEDQSPRDQARNLAPLMAAIDGVLKAEGAMKDLLLDGAVAQHNGRVTNAGKRMQLHLVTSARAALAGIAEGKAAIEAGRKTEGTEQIEEANRIHARAVADEGAILAARAVGITDLAQVGPGWEVAYRLALQSGREMYVEGGRKTEAGPAIALEHMGEWIHALVQDQLDAPSFAGLRDQLSTPEGCQALAERLLDGGTVGDAKLVVEREFGRGAARSGADLLAEWDEKVDREDPYNGWLIEILDIAKANEQGAEGRPPLGEGEQIVLGLVLRLANLLWKAAQVHRASTDDATRVSPIDRGGVYNPYEVLVAQQPSDDTQASNETALHQVWKDLGVLQAALKAR